MRADELLVELHANPELAVDVVGRLRVASPWRERSRTHRSGVVEWERVQVGNPGRVVAEVYGGGWLGPTHWTSFLGSDSNKVHPSAEAAKKSADRDLAAEGWAVTSAARGCQ